MRLRLCVHRHELPPTNILWNIPKPHQTIAELLDQLNDIVPLEAEEWGLEDYAVQVGVYEGLHFQRIEDVLKDEDEIIIRPLETNDIRARNLAGRRQITSDGRHLIDGIAYGRPQLKRPTRPAVTIPPRKRARLESVQDHGNQDETREDPMAMLQQIMAAENRMPEPSMQQRDPRDTHTQRRSSRRLEEDREIEQGMALIEQIMKGDSPKSDGESEKDLDLPLALVRSPITGEPQEKPKQKRVSFGNPEGPRKHLEQSPFLPSDEDDEESFRPSDEDMAEGAESLNEDFSLSDEGSDLSEGDIDAGNAALLALTKTPTPIADAVSVSSSVSDSSSSSSSSEDSSDVSSSEDDESEGQGADASRVAPSRSKVAKKQTAKSSCAPLPTQQTSKMHKPHMDNELSDKGSEDKADQAPQLQNAPYTGSKGTQARNKRKQLGKKMLYLKNQGILPSGATLAHTRDYIDIHGWSKTGQENGGHQTGDRASFDLEMHESDEDGSSDEETSEGNSSSISSSSSPSEESIDNEGAAQVGPSPSLTKGVESTAGTVGMGHDADFHQKRQTLLAAIAAGGVEISANGEMSSPNISGPGTPAIASSPYANGSTKESRRAKLDLAGSQRLLFGSLGLRAPKTDAEREKLQQKLAAKATRKPVIQPSQPVASQLALTDTAAEDDFDYDINAWKSMIDLSAVECCDGDVVLSTPPFPFRQRWDPSQQLNKKRKRNSSAYTASKSRNTNSQPASYYFDVNGDGLNYDDAEEGGYEDNGVDEEYYEEYDEDITAAEPDEDDLPAVPEDLTTLPTVHEDELAKGDVIIFSRLEVSAATHWQPAESPKRTATVEVIDNGMIDLRLAKRDLPEKEFDSHGKRMYRKFEVPYDDDEDEALLSVSFAELVDPRMLVKGTTIE